MGMVKMDATPPGSRADFQVAIICALPREFNAVYSVLDCEWKKDSNGRPFAKTARDLNNVYINGRIGPHNVVLVLLPRRMGKVSSATVGTDLAHSYPNLRLTLLVGICGGVPTANGREVVLGDVVISSSVVQYDFGRRYPDGFQRKDEDGDNLNGPDKEISGVLAMLDTDPGMEWVSEGTLSFLKELQAKQPKYAFPGAATDRLFRSDYRHKHQTAGDCDVCRNNKGESDPVCDDALDKSCEELGCDPGSLVRRGRLENAMAADVVVDPVIHVGRVATGDTVMKSGVTRDTIAVKEKVIAFEMEAAGIWERLSSLVVKGVCDYADSHKNKSWQDYAAATAAAAAKALLVAYIPTERETTVETSQPSKSEWLVPFSQDPNFVDEPDIMKWLGEKAQLPGARAALVGLGGMGKSQLAIQFAHQVRGASHVFWVNASTLASFQESYRQIAQTLGLEQEGDSPATTHRRVADWLTREQNGRWTVVVDNFDDPSALFLDDPALSKVLPQANHGFALITSRTVQAAEVLIGDSKNIWPISVMSEERAVALFRKKLTSECEESDVRELVRLLDYIPLAITQAAAYINRHAHRMSTREYAEMLEAGDDRGKLLGAKYSDLRRYSDASNSVLETWIITFKQIRNERPSAIDLLSLISCFNPQSIPEWVLKTWYSSEKIKLPNLRGRDVKLSQFESLRWKAIPLGRRYVNRPLSAEDNAAAYVSWAYPYLGPGSTMELGKGLWKDFRKKWFSSSKPSSDVDYDDYDEEAFIPRAVAAVGPEEAFEQDLETLFGYSLVSPTENKGLLKAHPLVSHCTREWLARSERIETWKRRFLLVMSHNSPRDWTKGPSARYDLSIHSEPLLKEDPEDPLSARLWLEIADSISQRWKMMGRVEEAIGLRERLVAVADRLLGEDDSLTLMLLNLQAAQLANCGNYDKAEAAFETLRERRDKMGDRGSLMALEDRAKHVGVLVKLGRFEEAEQAARSVVEQRARALGEKAALTLESTGLLAKVLAAMGKPEEACDIILRLIGEDWPDTTAGERSAFEKYLSLMMDIALDIPEAVPAEQLEPLLRAIVERLESCPETCRKFMFNAHPGFHISLAACLSRLGKVDEANYMLNRTMLIVITCFLDPAVRLPKPIKTLLEAHAANNSSSSDGSNDKKKETDQLLQEALDFLKSEKGRVDEQVYRALSGLARHFYLTRRPVDGSVLFETISSFLEQAYGRDHTLTGSVLTIWAELEAPERGRRPKTEGNLASRDADESTLVEQESG